MRRWPRTLLAKQPERTCIGCRTKRPAAELVRLVRLDDGQLVIGRTRPGRGAWLCRAGGARGGEQAVPAERCIEVARRRNAFARALRGPVSAVAVEALRAEAAKRARMEGRDD